MVTAAGARPTSAPTAVVLRAAARTPRQLAELLRADDTSLLAAAAESGQLGEGPCRISVVGPTAARLSLARAVTDRAASGTGPTAWRGPRGVWFTAREPLAARPGSVAFVFPGLEAGARPPRADHDDRADGADREDREDQEDDPTTSGLSRHGRAVLAEARLLTAGLAGAGVRPDAVVGQSVGEWSAATCAGLWSADQFDQELARWLPEDLPHPEVDYAVLGCGAQRAREVIGPTGGDLVLSHDNSPRQVVLCGPADEVADVVGRARRAGIIAQVLDFRSGFHTPMFRPFLAPFGRLAEGLVIRRPQVPVWSSTTGRPYPDRPEEVRDLFLRNLVQPVLFRRTVERMYDAGLRAFVQVGHGRSASLIGDVLGEREHLAVPVVDGADADVQILRAAGALWVEGFDTRSAPDGTVTVGMVADRADEIVHHRGTHHHDAGSSSRLVAFSTASQPWLADHTFFRQPPGWPDEGDRRPIVPGATLVGLMRQWAEEAAPGRRAVAIRDVELRRWICAAPPVEIPVTVTPVRVDALAVEIGGYATGTVELADGYPPAPHLPAPDLPAPDLPAPDLPAPEPRHPHPPIGASRIYQERALFHGPAFQGLDELLQVDECSARAVIVVPPAPGALLDNLGHLIGAWLFCRPGESTVAFPVSIERLEFFGPEPQVGQRVEARTRIRKVSPSVVVADGELACGGVVAVRVRGWQERRMLVDPGVQPAYRFIEHHTQAQRRAGGWMLVADRWPTVAARDLIVGGYLGAQERRRYEELAPRARRAHVLGRVAVKDAVRELLWSQGWGPLFPAQIAVTNDPDGRPRVRGMHGLALPPLNVSLSHSGGAAVAVCRPSGQDVGIDVEQVVPRQPGVLDLALTDRERHLLAELVEGSGEPEPRWFTRFWAAKEAVGKAEGTGLCGRPRDFEVLSATASTLHVRAPGRVHRVRCTRLGDPVPPQHRPDGAPPGQQERSYVVAWTTQQQEG